MTRILGALSAALFTLATTAHAAETRIVVEYDQSPSGYAKVVDAASKLCSAARTYDLLDEFGSQGECVENSIQQALNGRGAYQ